ncbi:MAG: hypothetical protein ACE5ES_02700 [Candidatus Nanoarchaeia archaeon]
MKILFVCKHNRFRSKIAEAWFKKYNKNKENKVKSAGIYENHDPLDKYEVLAAKGLGIKLSGKSIQISDGSIDWADTIIITADDVSKKRFENLDKKLIVWKIKDATSNEINHIKDIIKIIEDKIKELLKELK